MLSSSKKRGFTLIELLVVIAIIGILAGVVLGSLNQARQKARDTQRIGDIKEIELALELYADANSGTYPTPATNVAANCVAGAAAFGLEALVPNYLNAVPRDPTAAAPNCYRYVTNANRTRYHIAATLEQQSGSLNEDRDCSDLTDNGCWTGTAATNLPANGVIDGISALAGCASDAGTTDLCYDVTN